MKQEAWRENEERNVRAMQEFEAIFQDLSTPSQECGDERVLNTDDDNDHDHHEVDIESKTNDDASLLQSQLSTQKRKRKHYRRVVASSSNEDNTKVQTDHSDDDIDRIFKRTRIEDKKLDVVSSPQLLPQTTVANDNPTATNTTNTTTQTKGDNDNNNVPRSLRKILAAIRHTKSIKKQKMKLKKLKKLKNAT
jgi:hypothetical protein